MAPAAAPPLSEAERERSARLTARIREEAERAGVLPFDRYVELALYDPIDGYYAQPTLRLGRSGDFYTAAHVHPIFGRTVARRVLAELRRIGAPASFQFAEVGAGDGALSGDLREAWSAFGADAPAIDHLLIDVPGPRLVALAAAWGRDGGAGPTHVRVAAGLGDRGPIRGVILANELLDALPFRRLVRKSGRWWELGVRSEGGGLGWGEAELVRPVGPPALPELPDGAVLEISEAAEGWIRQAGDTLVDGAIVLLDYGALESEGLWNGPGGTLGAVRGHRAGVDPLAAPGTCDLSAFVDFTRIRAPADRAGLREVAYRRQSDALGAWGLPAVLEEALRGATTPESAVKIQLAAKSLLFGFEGFRVLELSPSRPDGAR